MALVALVAGVLALAACGGSSGSGPGASGGSSPQSADARLAEAGTTVQQDMARYLSTVQQCTKAQSPVVCLEQADRTLGGQIHDYANFLAVGHGFRAPAAALTTARNAAQTLANSLEILGDAEPTQANYNQVLNTFNVNAAIASLQNDVAKVRAGLR